MKAVEVGEKLQEYLDGLVPPRDALLARMEEEAHRENMAQLMDWAKSGILSVHVHATYPLEEYRKAFDAIAKRQVLGKTLLQLGAGAD